MKSFFIFFSVLCFFTKGTDIFGQSRSTSFKHYLNQKGDLNEQENSALRDQYELMRQMDPGTEKIPLNIRAKELKFSSQIPTKEQFIYSEYSKKHTPIIQATDWVSRGPSNIGGRTYALAVDIKNENIILAGSTSGGMWRSTDQGNSWIRTTPVTELPSVRSLVQDTRQGKTNIWYYGTGEIGSNTAAYPMWLNQGASPWGNYYGNGIYKSTDNGQSWSVLASTATQRNDTLNQPFNFVNKLVIDPSNNSKDIVYAAVAGGIERSSDGGATWTMVLGDFASGPAYTDVAITSSGILYAAMSNVKLSGSVSNPKWNGIYRSTDGINWVNITPAGWQKYSYLVSLGIAPSNNKIVYAGFFSETTSNSSNYFWRYSADTDTSGTWDDRSSNFDSSVAEPPAYIKVKPDDENVVFVGSTHLWRTTDGFATANNVSNITYLNGQPNLHVDHQIMVFLPSNLSTSIVGCDGGLFMTSDNLADNVEWAPLDNNYLTAQFYTTAIDHSNVNDIIIGGMQDNSTAFTNTTDETQPWNFLFGGDGATCAIAKDRSSYYVSYQYGNTVREIVDDNGNILDGTRIDPIGSGAYVWINPFVLDPNNTNRMYLGGGNFLWRNNDVTAIPMGFDTMTSVNWDALTHTRVTAKGSVVSYSQITAIAVSTIPANSVYYGTNDGQVYRLDSADSGNRVPVSIWRNKGFPANAFVGSIAVDPANSDNVMISFANYDVQSIFYSSDGGSTWTPVGGNLEEYQDGTGNGPSIRWVSILHVSNGIVYLTGTSTGLYSTSELNGMSTIWMLEGASTIGHNIVNMMDVRELDGEVAVATCGQGIFTGVITSVTSGVSQNALMNPEFILAQNYPNPYSKNTNFVFNIKEGGPVTLKIYNVLGKEVATVLSENLVPGSYTRQWNNDDLPAGIYLYRLVSEKYSASKQMIFVK